MQFDTTQRLTISPEVRSILGNHLADMLIETEHAHLTVTDGTPRQGRVVEITPRFIILERVTVNLDHVVTITPGDGSTTSRPTLNA